MPSRGDNLEHALRLDEGNDALEAFARLEVREHERPRAAHALRVAVHDLERGADHRREIDLVDDQQVALGDAGAALARDLVAGRHVDHVQRQIRQLRAEGGREIVAARLDQNEVEPGEAAVQPLDRLEVDRRILADRGVRAAAGLDADDPLRRERLVAYEELRVLFGVDVVRHDRDVVALAEHAAERKRECRLP